jgi:hypothetical protein
MNPAEQRIAIGKACGKQIIIPDYLNDLNAMHEAERHIANASDQMKYAAEILKVMGLNVSIEDDINVDYCWHACRSNAAQRAEAFLKTLDLWKP